MWLVESGRKGILANSCCCIYNRVVYSSLVFVGCALNIFFVQPPRVRSIKRIQILYSKQPQHNEWALVQDCSIINWRG